MENKVLLEVKNLKKYFNTPKGLLHISLMMRL